MIYTKDYVEEALGLLFFDGLSVQNAREEGMPGGGADPRKAQDGHVMMIDVRRAWDDCEWLSYDQRQALLAFALVGTRALASFITRVPEKTVEARREAGLVLMVEWLNSTYVDRAAWEEELAEEYHTKLMAEQWDDYYRAAL